MNLIFIYIFGWILVSTITTRAATRPEKTLKRLGFLNGSRGRTRNESVAETSFSLSIEAKEHTERLRLTMPNTLV
jgi:hypothetical protein